MAEREIEVQAAYALVKTRVEEQGLTSCYLEQLLNNIKSRPVETLSLAFLTDRMCAVQRYRERVTKIHSEILSSVEEELRNYITYFSLGVWNTIQQLLASLESYLSEQYNRLNLERETVLLQSSVDRTAANNTLLNTSAAAAITHVKLPEIQLPKFSGDYTKWSNFRDLFTSIIHQNESLTKVQKLQYLKLCLEEEASVIVKSLPIDDKSYDLA